MADKEKKEEEKKEAQDEQTTDEEQKDTKESSGLGIFLWLIVLAVVIAGIVGGFALAQLITPDPPQPTAVKSKKLETKTADELLAQASEGSNAWQYDLESVVANLDEPGVTRYIRATISIQLSPEMDPEKGKEFLDRKILALRDWLTTYLAGMSLEQVRGTRNLSRIKKEIKENFNELLFPQSKPFITNIFFKDFAVQ